MAAPDHQLKHHKSLFIRDVFTLLNTDTHVSVCGVVVDIVKPDLEVHSNRPLTVSVDDGTGEVRCVMFGFQHHKHLINLDIGDCVVVRGVVCEYKNQLQIKCENIKLVTDPNFETLWINKTLYEMQTQR